jgi:glycosyltransferase involved in cell wall biosynthesis
LPNVAFRHRDAAYLRAALAGAASADVVVIDFIGMFWLAAALRRALRTSPHQPRIITVNHNVEADVRRQFAAAARGVMRPVLAYDARKAARLERDANRLADGRVAITEPDRAVLDAQASSPSIALSPGYDGPRVAVRDISDSVARRVAILGNFEAQHKRVVVEKLLEALRVAPVSSDISIEVAGAGDFSAFTPPPGVSFKGYVPDLVSYLSDVRLGALCDPIGGGFKLRVLTYAFCRVPIIALPEAIEGSGLRPGEHFIPVASPADISSVIASVIDDFDRLNAMQSAAFAYAEANYDWGQRGRALDAFARELILGADRTTRTRDMEIAA